ncbi:hypothetical protein SAMN05192571_101101 [Pleomorphomonas diazotrophica]|uniref:hypothetical protein n=1 Tax=Pleomorphomonas diazotrophica TaxID=1166257 RepID=UPI0008E072FD|nr:hypothetical protein [Pleomorphomonas diazotrophica]SFM35564.1 hypothetical protein SAMN05192571_101101 [Pleomorphomonas diazotrophica]
MAPMSEIRIPHDMLRRRIVDVVPFCLRDFCGALATALLGAGVTSWLIAAASQSLGG